MITDRTLWTHNHKGVSGFHSFQSVPHPQQSTKGQNAWNNDTIFNDYPFATLTWQISGPIMNQNIRIWDWDSSVYRKLYSSTKYTISYDVILWLAIKITSNYTALQRLYRADWEPFIVYEFFMITLFVKDRLSKIHKTFPIITRNLTWDRLFIAKWIDKAYTTK